MEEGHRASEDIDAAVDASLLVGRRAVGEHRAAERWASPSPPVFKNLNTDANDDEEVLKMPRGTHDGEDRAPAGRR